MLRLDEFDLVAPESVTDAVAALTGSPGAMIVAGGTDLVPKLKRGQFEPTVLVSIARLRDLDFVEDGKDGVTIGAMTTVKTIERSQILARFGALHRAAAEVATPIIRNSATLGGNLLQDTRCRYYDRSHLWREAVGYCLKKDGDTCRVAPGGGRCFATFCSDLAPALIVHDASVTLAGAAGRTVPLEEMYLDDGMAHVDLRGEILTRITIPRDERRSTYKKLRMRDGFDFPEVGVAAAIGGGGAAVQVNVAVTGVGPRVAVLKVKSALADLPAVADRVFRSVKPVDTMFFPPAYRKKMVRQLLRRCFDELLSAR